MSIEKVVAYLFYGSFASAAVAFITALIGWFTVMFVAYVIAFLCIVAAGALVYKAEK